VTNPVTVGGYAAGQDPATLVLDVAAASHNNANSVGHAINAAGTAADPWAAPLPGSYASGTAGFILGNSQAASFPPNFASLAIDSSGRVVLQPSGVDAVIVEAAAGNQGAINMRQALSLVMCASPAGIVSGGGTAAITVKNPGKTATRIVASVDPATGNRSAVVLTPPA
jgi:hypothetical protein